MTQNLHFVLDSDNSKLRLGKRFVPLSKGRQREVMAYLFKFRERGVSYADLAKDIWLDAYGKRQIATNVVADISTAFQREFPGAEGAAAWKKLMGKRGDSYYLACLRPGECPPTRVASRNWHAACQRMLDDLGRDWLRRPVTRDQAEVGFRLPVPLALWAPRRPQQEPVEIPALVEALASTPFHMAVIGEAGAGKSTALEAICDQVLGNPARLAILVPAREVTDDGLLSYLEHKWCLQAFPGEIGGAWPELWELLASGAWLLVDGLDETSGDPLSKLDGWVRSLPLGHRLVVTCRQALWERGHKGLRGFSAYCPAPDADFERAFTAIWHGLENGVPVVPQVTPGLQRAVRGKVAAATPLLIAMRLSAEGEAGSRGLSKGRLVRLIAHESYHWRQIAAGLPPDHGPLLRHVACLAREMLDARKGAEVAREWAEAKIDANDPANAASVLDAAVRAGWLQEAGERRIGFGHASFLDYFAAEGVADLRDLLPSPALPPQPLPARYRVFEPAWRDAVLLWMGLASATERLELMAWLAGFRDEIAGHFDAEALLLVAAGLESSPEYAGVDALADKLIHLESWSPVLGTIGLLTASAWAAPAVRAALLRRLERCRYAQRREEIAGIMLMIDPRDEAALAVASGVFGKSDELANSLPSRDSQEAAIPLPPEPTAATGSLPTQKASWEAIARADSFFVPGHWEGLEPWTATVARAVCGLMRRMKDESLEARLELGWFKVSQRLNARASKSQSASADREPKPGEREAYLSELARHHELEFGTRRYFEQEFAYATEGIHALFLRNLPFQMAWLAWKHPLGDPFPAPQPQFTAATLRKRLATEALMWKSAADVFVVEARDGRGATALDIFEQLARQSPELEAAGTSAVLKGLSLDELRLLLWNPHAKRLSSSGRRAVLLLLEGPNGCDTFDQAALAAFAAVDRAQTAIAVIGEFERGLDIPTDIQFFAVPDPHLLEKVASWIRASTWRLQDWA